MGTTLYCYDMKTELAENAVFKKFFINLTWYHNFHKSAYLYEILQKIITNYSQIVPFNDFQREVLHSEHNGYTLTQI